MVTGHEAHASTFQALQDQRLGLAGHAWFETYSVLTRMPGSRRSPAEVLALLRHNFPGSRFLRRPRAEALGPLLAEHGIAGGAVYDALVASAATEAGLPLVSRDRHAQGTYRALGATVRLLG